MKIFKKEFVGMIEANKQLFGLWMHLKHVITEKLLILIL